MMFSLTVKENFSADKRNGWLMIFNNNCHHDTCGPSHVANNTRCNIPFVEEKVYNDHFLYYFGKEKCHGIFFLYILFSIFYFK